MHATGLRCVRCDARYPLAPRAACPACLGDLDVASIEDSSLSQTLAVDYDEPALRRSVDRDALARRPPGLSRYVELLPVQDEAGAAQLGAGGTPLVRLGRLEGELEACLWAKVEGQNPTGSFKDRPIGVACRVAIELGARTLACMTSGNIGSAMAAVAARAGVPAYVFLLAAGGLTRGEAGVNLDKASQIQAYGAAVVTPRGDMLTLTRLAREATRRLGWTWMHDLPAFQAEGDKTTAFEIAEQLGWLAPDHVVVPVGTGTNLFGVWKGFAELHRLGFIDRVPRIVGVQPEGADPLVRAVASGAEVMAPLPTVRPSLALPITHRVAGHHAYYAVQVSGGTAVAVSDGEMRQAVVDLGSREGIYTEPASAAALAGARKLLASGVAPRGSRIVCVLTSHGLKDGSAMRDWFGPPPEVAPTLESILRALPGPRAVG